MENSRPLQGFFDKALVARAGDSYVDPFDIAETFARAGMVGEAMHWLNRAIEDGSYELSNFAYWPHLDVLRDDPRYQDLMERLYGDRAEDIRRITEPASLHDR